MFHPLMNSVFLQVLGSAIVTSIWQTFILWLLYKIITLAFPKLSPSANHNLGVIFVFAGFGLFLLTILDRAFSQPSGSGVPLYAIHQVPDGYFSFHLTANVYTSLSVAYLILLGLLSVRTFYSLKNTLQIYHKRAKPAGERIDAFVSRAASLLHIQRKVTTWICEHITTPATIGFLKPAILLPAVCVTHLSPDQLEAIIVHELSHIKRNDYLVAP